MLNLNLRKYLMGTSVLVAACALALSPQVFAQDDAIDEEVEETVTEEVTVTGSRIKRDVFSSTTPIQILDADAAQRIGVVSISELLQKATAASGQQVDAGFNSNGGQTNGTEAPPDGGVGSACINLRGLGCERTLVLVNGKRLGVTGIRGAPPQPDINMLPIGMVEGVDVLTGGLSTVYGADAVAGVVNVRLKKDFEGLNVTANIEQPDQTGGEINQFSLVGGVGSDSGNITFGIEYSEQKRVRTGDRSYTQCLRRGAHNQTESGQVVSACRSDFPDNWVVTSDDLFASGFLTMDDGSDVHPVDATRLIFTPGTSNFGVPGYSTFASLPQTNDPNLEQFPYDGRPFFLDRFRYADSQANDQLDRQNADLWNPYKRFSLVMNGHLDLDWGHNEEFYFEGYYFNRQNFIIAITEQIFPPQLGEAPLVDSSNNLILDANGAVQMVDNPLNPFPTDLYVLTTLDDIPQTFDTELQQVRLVGGLTGDIGSGDNWAYDIAVSYDRGTGFVAQPIFLENHVFLATQTIGVVADPVTGLPTSEVICGAGRGVSDPGGQFTFTDCVPLNLLVPDAVAGDFMTDSGRFGTQAELDYLVQQRTNRTVTQLYNVEAYVTGDIFNLWNGEAVATAFGGQYRFDTIDSQNSAGGVLGLSSAENPLAEGETRGDRETLDFYGELSAPLMVDAGWADLFQLDLAGRYTDDENFGSEFVYKIAGLLRVNDYLAFNASLNTSFRAPNLREQFLADQAGALPGGTDPCTAPNLALAEPSPALDRLIANCIQSGADVTVLGSNFTVAIPTSTGGAAGLAPETSDSFTFTVSASQPWTDRFDFDIALTYWDIQIEDTVRALDPASIVGRCFNDMPNLASPFCERVERNRPTSPPDLNFISFVRAGFVNTGIETAKGYDLTTRLNAAFGDIDVNWSTATTFVDERLSQEFPPNEADPDGSAIVDDAGRIGNPEWTFQSTVGVHYHQWDLVWQARYWSDTEFPEGVPNPTITDTDGLCLSGCPVGQDPNEFFGDDGWTDYGFFNSSQFVDSLGPLRPVTEAAGQWLHDLGLSYNFERTTITVGVNNLFDKEPPLIDQASGPNRNNAVSSARYDLIGRSYFAQLVAQW